jgi:hypothetical protein
MSEQISDRNSAILFIIRDSNGKLEWVLQTLERISSSHPRRKATAAAPTNELN